MRNSVFWKRVAVAGLAALFYVGHGLHEQHSPAWHVLTSASAAEQPAVGEAGSWEQLYDGKNATWVIAARCKLPGGWLVAVRDAGLTYYPDPNHLWGRDLREPD